MKLRGYQRRRQNARNPVLSDRAQKLPRSSAGSAGATPDSGEGSEGGREPPSEKTYPIWLIELRNSLLVLVSLSLSRRSSMASTGFSWVSALRSSQTF